MTAMLEGRAPFRTAVGLALVAVALFMVASTGARLWMLTVAALLAAVAVALAVWRRRPARSWPWLLLAAALTAAAAGSAAQLRADAFTGRAQLGFVVGSMVVAVATAGFTPPAPPDRDRLSGLDTAIGVVSVATLAYQFLVQPYVDAGAGAAAIASAAALPTLDLVMLALLLRLRDHRPRHCVALVVLVVALFSSVASDTVVGLVTVSGQYRPGSPWDVFSLVSYLSLAVVTLHPSMTQVGLPAVGAAPSRVPSLLLLMPAGAVVPALCLAAAFGLLHLDLRVAAGAGLLLFLLAMCRAVDLLARTEHASLHDALTGLANLRRFRQELTRAPDVSHGVSALLAMLDLDDFKGINDTYGHTVGDALLVQVADRLTAVVPQPLLVARFGGDEFGVLAVGPDADAPDLADRVGSAMVSAFAEPFVLDGLVLRVSASVGVVVSRDVQTLERLQVDADVAMYAAKNAGRATYRVYSDSLRDEVLSRRAVAGELEQALRRPASEELWVAYQPVVAVDGSGVIALEALVRWLHPTRGELAPGEFLPAAQEAGLSTAVDDFVLRAAVRQLAAWCADDADFRSLRISVNMTAASLSRPALVPRVLAELTAAGLRPAQLMIEITEQTAMPGETELTSALEDLAAAGVGIAIDDFGTGYSALQYLERFPVSVLKLDRSLMSAVDTKPSRLLAAVTALAHSLGLTLIAEGVERPGQLAALHELEIACAQGFLFSPARPAQAAREYVQRRGVSPTGCTVPPAARL